MKKILGIAGAIAALIITATFIFQNTGNLNEGKSPGLVSSVVKEGETATESFESDQVTLEMSSISEKEVVLTKEEVLVLQQRSKEMTNELDRMTQELALNLDSDDKRKGIEENYQKLVAEQNQLAIQLVKANQQQMASQK